MEMEAQISNVVAREILDSRGNPTVEVEVHLSTGHIGTARVPSGASTGTYEALELRDGDKNRYLGKGVLTAVENASKIGDVLIKETAAGKSVLDQVAIDETILNLDDTPRKENIGANATLGVSLAVAHAGAQIRGAQIKDEGTKDEVAKSASLFWHIQEIFSQIIFSQNTDSSETNSREADLQNLASKDLRDTTSKNDASNNSATKNRVIENTSLGRLPVPLLNVINGGAHANNGIDIQEFMLVPKGAPTFAEALRYGAETYHTLGGLLEVKKMSTNVGDEGGFAPELNSSTDALSLMIEAIEKAGYEPGKDILLALDVAAGELFENGKYNIEGKSLSADEMVGFLKELAQNFPLISIEDGLDEEDWDGWKLLTEELGGDSNSASTGGLQLVGDDLFVTNLERLQKGIDEKSANAILIKPNQIGTLTETLRAVALAKQNNFGTVMSHRSGETSDTTIADLAVGTNCGQIKSGAPARSDRVSKYNRLLQIEDELNA